jgi:hypothetical protein
MIRTIILVTIAVLASLVAQAAQTQGNNLDCATVEAWADGTEWSNAFPEAKPFGALSPGYAASATAGTSAVSSPMALVQDWNRLPSELHQWDCGRDSLGQAKRCLNETFQGSGEYAGKSVTAHFDTINGLWHFMGFDLR